MARVLYSGVNEHGQPSEVMLGCAIGDIIPHFGTTAPPGTLVCDGSEVSREAYAELYEEIGSLCGQGDGSTTFNLPDLRDVWLVWAGAQHAAGEEVAEGLPQIVATMGALHGQGLCASVTGAFDDVNIGPVYQMPMGTKINAVTSLSFHASASSSIYGASDHVTPASVAVLPCIVYE